MKNILVCAAFIAASFTSIAQVGIGTTTPDASAALEIKSTTQGFLPPRMNKAQIDGIALPVEGLMVYCTDCVPRGVFVNYGAAFVSMSYPNMVNIPTGVTIADDEVYSTTGKIWKNKNLGAANVAASSTDFTGYGDLYQWGRAADGHQVIVRNSSTQTSLAAGSSSNATGPVASGNEGANFITSDSDWLSTQDDTRWNTGTEIAPVKTANDPCLSGYRVPTEAELATEISAFFTQDATGAYNSPLKFSLAGGRSNSDGAFFKVGENGVYWSSTVSGTSARYAKFNSTNTITSNKSRASGGSVRCIKE
ncbi:MAG: hypothetical protein ACKVK4_04535 [Flavobacteriales bacterium]